MAVPLVSIKMITYNHRAYIAQAIEGVLRQKTAFPIELVIGDDCSTDGTREIIRDFQKNHPDIIRIVTSGHNVGMTKNSYRTFKACQGTYIALCEGDDYWQNSDKLQKQVDYLEQHRECGMVHSEYDVLHAGSNTLINNYTRYRNFTVPLKPSISEILDGCRVTFRIQTCTVMIRRALYEKIVENDPFLHQNPRFLMGDTQLFAELATMADIGYIPESLATYRMLNESASRSRARTKALRFELSDSEMKLYLCDKYQLPSAVREKRKLAWYDAALRLAFDEKNVELARQVRQEKQSLSPAEWLRYLGAAHQGFRYAYYVAAFFRNAVKKRKIN